jgi:hypothetical protein
MHARLPEIFMMGHASENIFGTHWSSTVPKGVPKDSKWAAD